MEFEMPKYINLIENGEINTANSYRIESMPKELYKFVGINNFEEKMDTLRKNEFWLSTRENLNDPFELKFAYIQDEKIKKYNYPVDAIRILKHCHSNSYLIGCFTNNCTNNMPMWAHYASNHQGFCVKYKIKKPKFFYPISYEECREPANVLYMNILALSAKQMEGTITKEEKKKLDIYNALVHHMAIIKHKSWEYEKEYRLLFPRIITEKALKVSNNGVALGNNVIGIEIDEIYIGMSCSDEHKANLIQIGNKLGICVNEMYFEETSKEFELSYRKINQEN